MTVDVAIIGGGISGLATAYELTSLGHQVAVLERQVRVGGAAISEHLGGFLMEHGPSSVSTSSTFAVGCTRKLGLDAHRLDLGSGVRRRYLTRDNMLYPIAIHPLGFLTSSYLSLGGRLRLLKEAVVPPGRIEEDETIAAFFDRRFGPEFVDRVIDPLVGGIFAGAADKLSMAAVFPKLLEMERVYGSISRAIIATRRRGTRMPGRRLFSWRGGIGSLPRALADRLGPAIKTGIAVQRIVRTARGFKVQAGGVGAFDATAVIVATQPHVAATLLDVFDGEAAEAVAAIEAPPLAVVFLGYRRQQIAHPLDGLGYLTSRAERRPLSGALFCSTMFAGRAPEGHVALAGYVGGMRAPDLVRLAPDELIDLTRAEFADLLGARGDPVVARVRQWSRGLPQYGLGHRERIGTLARTEERTPGLFLTGNYLQGVSVAACLEQAARTAARVHGYLGRLSRERRPSLERPADDASVFCAKG